MTGHAVWWRPVGMAGSAVALASVVAVVGSYRGAPAEPLAHPGTTRVTAVRTSGLVRENSPGAAQTVADLRASLAATARLATTAGALYADATGAPRSVILATGTGPVAAPAARLDAAFAAVGTQDGPVTGVHGVPSAGPGIERCGATDTVGSPVVTCAWADGTHVAVGVFVGRPACAAAVLLAALRTGPRDDLPSPPDCG